MEALLASITAETLLTAAGWLAVGIVVGALSMMLGIGGGVLMVPAFRLVGRLSAVMSSATSIFVIVPTGIAGVLRHLRAGTCRVPIGLAAGIAGACTSVAGAKLADIAPGWVIMVMAAVVILYSAFTMLRSAMRDGKAKAPVQTLADVSAANEDQPAVPTRPLRTQVIIAACIGLAVGVLSGFVGVGGGFLMVPLFLSILHLDMRTAAGTSLFAVFCLAIPAAIAQIIMGNVSYLVGIPVAIGAIFGTKVGKWIAARMSDRGLKIAFSVLLATSAILLIINEL